MTQIEFARKNPFVEELVEKILIPKIFFSGHFRAGRKIENFQNRSYDIYFDVKLHDEWNEIIFRVTQGQPGSLEVTKG